MLFAAYLSWLHATQEVFVIAHDVRPVAVVCAILAIALLVECLRFGIRRAVPGSLEKVLIGAVAIAAIIVLPGRVLQYRRTLQTFGSDDRRAVHNALRLLISAQEDHRIHNAGYATALPALNRTVLAHVPEDITLAVARASSERWTGNARGRGIECWVDIGGIPETTAHPHRNFLDDEVRCGSSVVEGQLVEAPRTDSAARAGIQLQVDSSSLWNQERGSPDRRGIAPATSAPASWDVRIGGSVRAVSSIADPFVIVGSHGTGWLGALELRSGALSWQTRAPNWIHQNPLIARGNVYVGLGDRGRLLAGDDVGLGFGGVAAYALGTGELRWLVRTRGAVMTAPVVHEDRVISADGAGRLQAWSADSGRPLWTTKMPGQSVMASPALRDSTIYVALAHRRLCAFAAYTGAQRWCFEAPRAFRIGGDATPSVIGGAVYWSLSYDSTGSEMLFRGTSGRDYVREKMAGRARSHSSQWVFAVDALSGRERWRREIGGGYPARGNMAGTALAYDASVVIVAPRARRLASLDTATGALVWVSELDAFARGAPTIVDSLIIASDSAKHVHVLHARTGRPICTGILPEASDRAGPTVAGGTAVFTGLSGLVMARRLDRLLRCASE